MLTRRHVFVGALAGLATACSAAPSTPAPADKARGAAPGRGVAPKPAPPPVFPDNRLIGFSGAPGSPQLGRMTGNLRSAAQAMTDQIDEFDSDRPVVPVVELIATVAHDQPGVDGMYRTRTDEPTIVRYLEQARENEAMLLLNIQPARGDLRTEVAAYERWLTEPDVGMALDPEWAVRAPAVPGSAYGSVTGDELDAVADYLGGVVAEHGLPDKVMVYHQVAASVVRNEERLREHRGVALVKSVDGIGDPGMKREAWDVLMRRKPAHVQPGFKLFYDEDTKNQGRLMTPQEVLALRPAPSYILYE